jgi:solute carrier family 25 folate transporter 32
MFTYIPAMAVYFPAYNWAKQYWIGPIRSTTGWTDVDVYSPSVHIAAAVTAGCMTNTFTQPLWLVRTRQMSANVPLGTLSTLGKIVRNEGVRALYKGLGSSMFGLFHVIIQFPLYERLKLVQRKHPSDQNTTWQILLASTISKVCASTTTYPHEIIRTRLQLQTEKSAKYRGIWHAVKTIAAEEGLKGFYGGLKVNVLRVVPASAITFVSYEKLLQFVNTHR